MSDPSFIWVSVVTNEFDTSGPRVYHTRDNCGTGKKLKRINRINSMPILLEIGYRLCNNCKSMDERQAFTERYKTLVPQAVIDAAREVGLEVALYLPKNKDRTQSRTVWTSKQ